MVRPQLHDVLGHVVHARISMDGLQQSIIMEMRTGYRPSYRGHEWGREHFEALTAATQAIEAAFNLIKWCQWPEDRSRLELGMQGLRALPPHSGLI
jgi:hypothetical protein